MKFYLHRLIINGVKNIDQPIEMLFSNKTITDSFDTSDCNIKAIYGPNGSGKSGIVCAVYLYKKLVEDSSGNGLSDSLFSDFVLHTINNRTKELSLDFVFSVMDDPKDHKSHCFRHKLTIGIENHQPIITSEEIFLLKGKSINDSNFKSLIKTERGSIISISNKKEEQYKEEPIYYSTLNLLNKHVLSCAIKKPDFENNSEEIVLGIRMSYQFASSLIVVLNESDTHSEYFQNLSPFYFYPLNPLVEDTSAEEEKKTDEDFFVRKDDCIKIKDYPQYEEKVRKLTKFIRIFKPNLEEIRIDKKVDKDSYRCHKLFCYKDYTVDSKFESTGIKKLVRLYSALTGCANGRIAFIDEMDSNLHDVYFTKLIEFFKDDGKGQLCFTTHNLEPINLLKDKNHSLDFLSDDSRIYSWRKNGNRSPKDRYVHGLIPYSPFNIESFSFDVLIDEEEE